MFKIWWPTMVFGYLHWLSLISVVRAATDLYEVLGVSSSASGDDIRKGFRTQSLKYHPDKQTAYRLRRLEFRSFPFLIHHNS